MNCQQIVVNLALADLRAVDAQLVQVIAQGRLAQA